MGCHVLFPPTATGSGPRLPLQDADWRKISGSYLAHPPQHGCCFWGAKNSSVDFHKAELTSPTPPLSPDAHQAQLFILSSGYLRDFFRINFSPKRSETRSRTTLWSCRTLRAPWLQTTAFFFFIVFRILEDWIIVKKQTFSNVLTCYYLRLGLQMFVFSSRIREWFISTSDKYCTPFSWT